MCIVSTFFFFQLSIFAVEFHSVSSMHTLKKNIIIEQLVKCYYKTKHKTLGVYAMSSQTMSYNPVNRSIINSVHNSI